MAFKDSIARVMLRVTLCGSPALPRLCSGELPTTWKEEDGFILPSSAFRI
jgi:hypothetical protein